MYNVGTYRLHMRVSIRFYHHMRVLCDRKTLLALLSIDSGRHQEVIFSLLVTEHTGADQYAVGSVTIVPRVSIRTLSCPIAGGSDFPRRSLSFY